MLLIDSRYQQNNNKYLISKWIRDVCIIYNDKNNENLVSNVQNFFKDAKDFTDKKIKDKKKLDEMKKSDIKSKGENDTIIKIPKYEEIIKGKKFYNYKKQDIEKEEKNNTDKSNDINDKMISNSSNALNGLNIFNKDNNLSFLNKKFDMNSCTKMIQINNINEQKTNNCTIL
jgi:hypothetical protein